MNPFKHVRSQFHLTTSLRTKKLTSFIHLNPISYHSSTESYLNPQSSEWREKALPKLIKLTPLLNNLDLINGKLINIHDKSTVNDEFLLQSMHNFKSIATSFLAYHSIIESSSTSEGGKCNNYLCVGKILTFIDEKMVRREVKKLDRAIGVIRFVYEMAEMKEVLEVRGHLWGVGCENRSVVYRGNKFFIHGIGM